LRKKKAFLLESENRERGVMVYKLGRFLQIVAMILLPLAIAGNLSPERPLTLGQSLTMSTIGVIVFIFGYLLQQMGRK
jgi:hypothetical protein